MPGEDLDQAIASAEGMAAKLRAVAAAANQLADAVKKPERDLGALAASLRRAQGLPPAQALRHLNAARESKRRFEEEKPKVEKLVQALAQKIASLQHPTAP